MNKQLAANKFADVPIRIISWGYIIIVLSLGLINSFTMSLFVCLLSLQANREFIKMFVPKSSSILILLIIAAGQYYLLCYKTLHELLLYSLIITIGTTLFFGLYHKLKLNYIIPLFIGFNISLVSLSVLYFTRTISNVGSEHLGLSLVIFLIVITELNDVFQYISGKFFGKTPIVPKISPNKTLEGLLGGILLSICLSNILGSLLFDFYNWKLFILIGFLLSVFGFLGDILMSYFKRIANVKDTGTLIPGHGGLLDRIDSLTFNAGLFYILTSYFILH